MTHFASHIEDQKVEWMDVTGPDIKVVQSVFSFSEIR